MIVIETGNIDSSRFIAQVAKDVGIFEGNKLSQRYLGSKDYIWEKKINFPHTHLMYDNKIFAKRYDPDVLLRDFKREATIVRYIIVYENKNLVKKANFERIEI